LAATALAPNRRPLPGCGHASSRPPQAWEKQGSASCSESFVATQNMPYQVIAAAMYSFIYTSTITVQLVEEGMLGRFWSSESIIRNFGILLIRINW
jgi:hypothetical protein